MKQNNKLFSFLGIWCCQDYVTDYLPMCLAHQLGQKIGVFSGCGGSTVATISSNKMVLNSPRIEPRASRGGHQGEITRASFKGQAGGASGGG